MKKKLKSVESPGLFCPQNELVNNGTSGRLLRTSYRPAPIVIRFDLVANQWLLTIRFTFGLLLIQNF